MEPIKQQKQSRIQEDFGFRPEDYYQKLKNHTAVTVFCDLTKEESQAILHYYFDSRKHQFTIQDYKSLKSVEQKIKKTYKDAQFKQFFLRLSHRSPKDGIPYDKKYLKEAFQSLVSSNLFQTNNTLETANTNLVKCFNTTSKILKCKNQKDAMNLLLTSQRIAKDIQLLLSQLTQNPSYIWQNKLIIRQWDSGIKDNYQFRCFVKNNTLRAISQYNHYIFINQLQSLHTRNIIRSFIYKYWKTYIKDILSYLNDYVIDFAVRDDQQGDLTVIQLNPYKQTTGPALMYWHSQELSSIQWQDNEIKITFAYKKELPENTEVFLNVMQSQIEEGIKSLNYQDYLKQNILPHIQVPPTHKKCQIV